MSTDRAPSRTLNGSHVVNHEENTDMENSVNWGDNISSNKDNNIIRIMFQNIGGLGYNHENSKAESLKNFMNQYEVDIMTMAEVNVNWRRVTRQYSIYDLANQWFESKTISFAYNQRARCKTGHLPGGVGIISRGEAALRNKEAKQDKSRLGRWSWNLLQGKDNNKVRIVSVYVPKKGEYGEKKIYCQQQNALQKMRSASDPLKEFWVDFWDQIDEWLEAGEKLIIAGDWNEDVREERFLQKFKERHLIPAITDKHGNNAPPTYNRGSDPIDEIFVSPGIDITAAGYLAHGDGLGDHRPIWIDVTKDSALGAKLPDLPSFKARRLKLKDPRIVNKYLNLLKAFTEKHNLNDRINTLFASITPNQPLSKKQSKEYENIDKIREAAMKYAEKNCRHLYMGGVRWSPKLQNARDKIKYIKNSISRLKGTHVNGRTLLRDSKRAGINVQGMSLSEMEKKLNEECEKYKEIKKQHVQHRQSYLEEVAQALADQGKGKKASHLRNLIQIEEQRDVFRKLKRIMRKDQNLGTTFVTVTDENGVKQDLVQKEQIEEAIMNENCRKYHQSETSCPFLFDDNLRKDFGNMGEGPATTKVFEGTYSPDYPIDEHTRAFLDTCKYPDNVPAAQLNRTVEEYKTSWEKMNERISSRQLHFGHFKAATRDPTVIDMHYKMAEIPYRTGYAPTRWKNATQVMILKKAGLYDVERLRTIVLYEADFNHNNKYMGKKLMEHTIDNKLMAKEQYSLPGKKSIDHALNRRLIFDITRYKKTSLAMTSCDLKSCYDRIVHTPAFIAIAGYKFTPTPIFSMFECIQDMKWTTRTAYGDSDITFGGEDPNYIAKPQGVGQGNGSGPPTWSTVSSRMFEVLHINKYTTKFTAPMDQQLNLTIAGFAYVDDSDIIAATEFQNDPELTVKKMQKAIDCWEGTAKVTGGALEPSKSWWYLVFFEWKDGEWTYGSPNTLVNDTLTAKDKTGERVELQHLPSDKAQTMLGVELAPDGNNDAQFKKLKQKAEQLGEHIRTGYLEHSEAWLALRTMAMKSIEYPLPASTLSAEQLNKIMWPILRTYLPKSGVNRRIPRTVLYGPIHLQGLGLHNPYHTQGASHIVDLIENTWKGTITGNLILQSLQHLRIELGTNQNILESKIADFKPLLLTESWIRHVWGFMSKEGITWQDDTPKIALHRQNDRLLMEEALKCKTLSNAEVKNANKCRIYLQVASLADIATAGGDKICKWAFDGRRIWSRCREEYKWPKWGKPSKYQWAAWRKFLKHAFCESYQHTFQRPLGKWITGIPENWEWFEHKNEDDLFRKTLEGEWERYNTISRRTRTRKFRTYPCLNPIIPPITDMIPTTIQEHKDYIQSEGSITVENRIADETLIRTVTLPKWLFFSKQQSESIEQVISSIRDGTAVAVSDGSYSPHNKRGAASWTIEATNRAQYIRGSSIAPGPLELQNPYRSEILGVLAILQTLVDLCKSNDITEGHVSVHCDGLTALRQSTRKKIERISSKSKHSDLLSACCQLINQLPISITPTHVKGHRDDVVSFENLTTPEVMNVEMDINAKLTLQSFSESSICNTFLNSPPHHLSFKQPKLRGRRIYHDILNELRDGMAENDLHLHWIHKQRYTTTDIPNILWTPLKIAMKKSTVTRRRFIAKWSSHNVATGKNMKRWKQRVRDHCPFCTAATEDTSHILCCNHVDAMTVWKTGFKKYLVDLYKCGLDLKILLPLYKELMSWKQGEHPNTVHSLSSYEDDVRQVLQAQRVIGWKQFLEGLWATEWERYVTAHNTHPLKTAENIIGKCIQKNWDLIFNLWEGRNKRLHETDHIADLEGRTELITAIHGELRVGIGCLPTVEYRYLFTMPKQRILNKSLEWQKGWLSTIKMGREIYRDHHRINDDFSKKGTLRNWLGMGEPT